MGRWRAVLAVVLTIPAAAVATNTYESELTCPICGTKFSSTFVGSSSTAGADEEGRPKSIGDDIQRYQIHTCTKCRYTAFADGFPPGKDTPAGEDISAIRKALAGKPGRGSPSVVNRAALCERCYRARGSSQYKLFRACLLGAWLSDDANRPAPARRYREKALIAAGQAVAADRFPNAGRKWETHYVRGVLTAKLGRDAEAVPLLEAVQREMLPVVREAWRKNNELWEKREKLDANASIEAWNAAGEAQELAMFLDGLYSAASTQEDNARQRVLGPERGRAAALAGGDSAKLAYLRIHGTARDPNNVAAVLTMLADEKAFWEVRGRAAVALAKIGPVTESVVPSLIRALSDANWGVRSVAACALGTIGPAVGPEAAKSLEKALRDKEQGVREQASEALERIRGKPKQE